MHFISQTRYNPSIGADDYYYRIKESVRDLTGRVHSYVLLNVGFMTPRLKPGQVRDIAVCLNWLSEHRDEQDLFGDAMSRYDETVRSRACEYWQRMVDLGTVDRAQKIIEESRPKAERLVDVDTMEHTDAREVGAEWICLQAIRELEIDRFLEKEGWSETQINTALAQLITRTVYSPSELKSLDIMRENSAVCELLTGSQEWQRVLVCLDAGIATEDNLVKIKEKGYDYLCVSRSRLKDYGLEADAETVKVLDSLRQEISLTRVRHEEGGDYYLEINSPGKQLKEESMNRLFKERFEKELDKARESLTRKGGKKTYEKVIERVGRAIQKYPSISKYYVIDYIRDEKNPKNMGDIQWRIAVPENVDRLSGIYFLRTNRDKLDGKTTWDYYNLIREIECTNRQLKTDLNLRPIYHQKDERSDAHLFMGLLAYWIVNTIRYRMKLINEKKEMEANKDKKPGEKWEHYPTPYWTEILRRMSTQKAVTTEAVNALGEKVQVRLCSTPKKEAADIYEMLGYKKMPFWRKIKVCSTQ